MKIKDAMTENPRILAPDTPVREVARLMEKLDVGMIPVCDGEKLQGMVTDRDIAIRGVAKGLDLERTRAEEIMTPDVLYCFEDQETTEAAEMMESSQVRRLVVLDRNKRLTGILSIGDLATKTEEQGALAEAVEGISRP